MAELIDGKAIAQQVRDEVRDGVAAWVAAGHEPPGLATILVGDDPASAVYVNGKQKASAEAGIRGFDHRLPADATHGEVSALLHGLNADPAVNGILLQLPTPPQVDGPALTEEIAPSKDVDGLTPISTGLLAKARPGLRPCTPLGIMELLRRHDVATRGRRGGRRRPLRPRRQADLRAPAPGERDRHDRALAHDEPARGLRPRGHPGRRRRRRAPDQGRRGSSRAPS